MTMIAAGENGRLEKPYRTAAAGAKTPAATNAVDNVFNHVAVSFVRSL
ncbi:MAG: hypothetical protein Q8M26_17185 [Pseudolabrys sp.]|nr:hypothetical protein [Pseudolabrys sp.]